MSTPIEQLAALQTFDTTLHEMRVELARLGEAAAAIREDVGRKAGEASERHRQVRDLQTKQRELEGQLRDEEGRIRERKMLLQRVRNDKEFVAFRREIELRKEACDGLEEELLQVMEDLETRSAEVKTLEEELAADQANLGEAEKSLAERTEALRGDLERVEGERAASAASVDQGLLSRYDRILAVRDGLAVVPAVNGNCKGCGMVVPPQLLTEVHRGVEIITCPNCHRIVYVPRAPAPEAAEAKAE